MSTEYHAELSPEDVLAASVAIDSELVQAAKRKDPGVTVGMHICRGNNRSAWMAQGSYEPVAERLFGEVGAAGVDRFLLEYDTERAGGFEPLRFVPPGTTAVLGLVTSKVPRLESEDELCRRIEAAIERKIEGKEIEVAPTLTEPSGKVIDLMEALRASLEKRGKSREAAELGPRKAPKRVEEPAKVVRKAAKR